MINLKSNTRIWQSESGKKRRKSFPPPALQTSASPHRSWWRGARGGLTAAQILLSTPHLLRLHSVVWASRSFIQQIHVGEQEKQIPLLALIYNMWKEPLPRQNDAVLTHVRLLIKSGTTSKLDPRFSCV